MLVGCACWCIYLELKHVSLYSLEWVSPAIVGVQLSPKLYASKEVESQFTFCPLQVFLVMFYETEQLHRQTYYINCEEEDKKCSF